MSEGYSARVAGIGDAALMQRFYEENLPELHGVPIPLSEWESLFTPPDPDECNYIIMRGECPVGWFRVNGLDDTGGTLWLAMLVIGRDFKRQGAGRFAVDYAESFARSHGYAALGIHTTGDNLPAQALYESRGFVLMGTEPFTYGDGQTCEQYTYHKAF